jgi:transposase
MTNRLLKGAHLSERKCKEIINLFSEDLTATQISHITHISRITINAYLKNIRTNIAHFCEARNPLNGHFYEEFPHAVYFGFFKWDNQMYTIALADMNKDILTEWVKMSGQQLPVSNQKIQAIADMTNWKLYRLDHQQNSKGSPVMDDISGFWGLTKNRLLKFRGLNKNTIYLHMKECEYRYNFRNENINALVNKILFH